MFSVVFQFSFLVSRIGLGDFSPNSHSSFQQFPRSAEFVSEERGNYNHIILGAESHQNRSHLRAIIRNFTLVSLTSTIMPHLAGLLFRATVSSHFMHSINYLTPQCLRSRKVFMAVGIIYILSTC